MYLSPWLVRLGVAAALFAGSALCAGWKWDHVAL
jgi:hypothetical protein